MTVFDGKGMLQAFGDHPPRLREHSQNAKGRVNFDRVFGFNTPEFGDVAIDVFDSALSVLTILAHVSLASGTIRKLVIHLLAKWETIWLDRLELSG